MNEMQPQEAVFKFDSYKISSFSFYEPKNDEQKINLAFNPSGVFIKNSKTFVLILEFAAIGNDDGDIILKTKLESIFKFESIELETIPAYFYKNAIAIVFPYLRAFISTLTQLASVKHLLLPILNLESLEKKLKENVSQIDFGEVNMIDSQTN